MSKHALGEEPFSKVQSKLTQTQLQAITLGPVTTEMIQFTTVRFISMVLVRTLHLQEKYCIEIQQLCVKKKRRGFK